MRTVVFLQQHNEEVGGRLAGVIMGAHRVELHSSLYWAFYYYTAVIGIWSRDRPPIE